MTIGEKRRSSKDKYSEKDSAPKDDLLRDPHKIMMKMRKAFSHS
jgi:hypothetical protein